MAWHRPARSVPCRASAHLHTHTRDAHSAAPTASHTRLRPRRSCARTRTDGLHTYAPATGRRTLALRGGDLAHGLTSGDRADAMAGWKPAPHLRPRPTSRGSDRASVLVWSQLSGPAPAPPAALRSHPPVPAPSRSSP